MLKTASSVINAIGALNYAGTWNANTNNPTLTSGVGTKGNYYVVSVAGTTTLDGISLWSVGDWAVFNGTAWQKVDGSSSEAFSSITVTGLTGYMYANNTSPVTASLTIPNSGLANSTATLGNATITLGSTTSTVGNLTLNNVTINSGNVTANLATSTSIPVANATGTLVVSHGGTGLTTLTANYIPYGNGTGAFNSSSNFTYDGSVLNIGGTGGANTLNLWGTNGVGLRFANTSTGNSAYITSNASDVLNIQSNNGSINFLISGGVSKIYAKGSNGYVGINNSSPAYQLDVVGNGNFSTYLNVGTTIQYGTTVYAVGANANTLTTCGAYAGYSISNGPSTFPNPSAWILIEVFNTGYNIIWQRCTDAPYGSNAVKNRGSTDGGSTWTSWV